MPCSVGSRRSTLGEGLFLRLPLPPAGISPREVSLPSRASCTALATMLSSKSPPVKLGLGVALRDWCCDCKRQLK